MTIQHLIRQKSEIFATFPSRGRLWIVPLTNTSTNRNLNLWEGDEIFAKIIKKYCPVGVYMV